LRAEFELIIFRIWRVWSSRPNPQSSTPALLETAVMFFTPESRNARMSCSGMPQSPKPPTATVMPSKTKPSSAACGDA
jgi:hypothetical protein